jgi:LPXTG-site transpeptidase (sortase) family protein
MAMQNPLFPVNNNDSSQIPDYLRTSSTTPHGFAPGPQPTWQSGETIQPDNNAAADLIRRKLQNIYAGEPDATQEIAKVESLKAPLSKHQQYMQALNESGRSIAEIQAAWHEYYTNLPDNEKYEVWQEFYSANRSNAPIEQQAPSQQQQPYAHDLLETAKAAAQSTPGGPTVIPADYTPAAQPVETGTAKPDTRLSVADIKKRIRNTVSAGGKLDKKQHLQSLGFGLASGAVVVFIFLFGFFNEVFLSPFIQPSRQATETPIIVDTASATVGQTPSVIIPKINVEIPTDYSQTTTDEKSIEAALDKGVVHYPTTVRPGQPGNAAFFGHSSNNIFNPGKYKFAFVLLHKLVVGDTFYLTYEGKAYAYEVISRRVVEPTEVSVLGPVANETATATLITCDPPGTSLKRLVVVGRQISPDPGGNAAPAGNTPILAATDPAADLPGNGPTLWSRMWNSIF